MQGTRMRRRFALVCAVSVALGTLSGCSVVTEKVDAAKEATRAAMVPLVSEGLKRPGTLTVGIRRGVGAPYVMDRGTWAVGLDVELAAALANNMGLPVTLVYVDDVIGALQTTCDCVMEVSQTEADGYTVACPYTNSAIVLFAEGDAHIVSAQELEGKRIAVQEGSSAQSFLEGTALTLDLVKCPTINDAFSTLKSGGCDFVAGHIASAAFLAAQLEGVGFCGSLTTPTGIGIAFPGGDDPVSIQLQQAYQRLFDNGVLKETRRRYFADVDLLNATAQVADVPMLAADEGPVDAEFVGTTGGDGTDAGSNAVVFYGRRY